LPILARKNRKEKGEGLALYLLPQWRKEKREKNNKRREEEREDRLGVTEVWTPPFTAGKKRRGERKGE